MYGIIYIYIIKKQKLEIYEIYSIKIADARENPRDAEYTTRSPTMP